MDVCVWSERSAHTHGAQVYFSSCLEKRDREFDAERNNNDDDDE